MDQIAAFLNLTIIFNNFVKYLFIRQEREGERGGRNLFVMPSVKKSVKILRFFFNIQLNLTLTRLHICYYYVTLYPT